MSFEHEVSFKVMCDGLQYRSLINTQTPPPLFLPEALLRSILNSVYPFSSTEESASFCVSQVSVRQMRVASLYTHVYSMFISLILEALDVPHNHCWERCSKFGLLQSQARTPSRSMFSGLSGRVVHPRW